MVLKRKRVMISPDLMAIQSHPQHLEKLFELLKIKRGLMQKKTPGHARTGQDQYVRIYRSCIGILLYISRDYIECQYTIRALSQSMSKPTENSVACLRHLCMYLLGCTQNCFLLPYKGHDGLLHYTPEDYTLELFSDSDWAKHRSS